MIKVVETTTEYVVESVSFYTRFGCTYVFTPDFALSVYEDSFFFAEKGSSTYKGWVGECAKSGKGITHEQFKKVAAQANAKFAECLQLINEAVAATEIAIISEISK